jgi:hypothetical protein
MHQPIFQRLLGPHIETEELDPHLVEGGLLKAEQEAVAGAAQTRIEQFTAGRVCSRIALGRLGVATTTPVLRGEDRAPIWPPGFVGTRLRRHHFAHRHVVRRCGGPSGGRSIDRDRFGTRHTPKRVVVAKGLHAEGARLVARAFHARAHG